MKYVIVPGDTDRYPLLGGKAGALAQLPGAEFPVPPWFALSPQAFFDSLGLAPGGDPGDDVLTDAALCSEAQQEVRLALAALCPGGEPVAVRSSALDEDSPSRSYAGMLESVLFVAHRDVPRRIADVWRSAFGSRVRAYRREHRLEGAPCAPAVLVQRMVSPDVSGVAFGADPVSGERGVAVVAAVFGLGTALVSGEGDADTFRIDRKGAVIEKVRGRKSVTHVYDEAQRIVVSAPLPPERAAAWALTDDEARAVARLVRRSGAHFGRPQDVEWAIAGGELHLLQSRPVTGLAGRADPGGARVLWDNSNIAESYSGVTTPLTFSFARGVYEEVYRQFCRLLGVPSAVVEERAEVFAHMLGLIRGRIYYNLLNWYRVLAMLPGYAMNRRFMEQMMGVRESLPEPLAAEIGASVPLSRARDFVRVLGTLGGLLRAYRSLPCSIAAFHRRLDDALAPLGGELGELRPEELAAQYRELQRRLLMRWDAPLVNDFFAMIFFGALRRLAATWCGDGDGTLQNDLLCGEGGMVSAEPALRLCALAREAAKDPAFAETLRTGTLEQVRREMARRGEFNALFARYLEKFGDRCVGELKLESATVRDKPLMVLRAAGSLAHGEESRAAEAGQAPHGDEKSDAVGAGAKLREVAEARVRKNLALNPLKRVIFRWVLTGARKGVRNRENLRFERTRLFGAVRRIFVELGRRFAAEGILDEPSQIFFLEVEEALGFVEGAASCPDLAGLARVRRDRFARFSGEPPPPGRFETRGMANGGELFEPRRDEAAPPAGNERRGLGCCPGVVRGRVRVVTDPAHAVLEEGIILVAERTDPGWVVLFPFARGLLVERGSLLSHSAIVAREMAIPAVVAIPDLMTWLRDGDEVELDGARGTVRKIHEP